MSSVKPSAVKGTIDAPPSKSMTVRAAAAAFLAKGSSRIRHVSSCDDGLTAFDIAAGLGAIVVREGSDTIVSSEGIHSGKPGKQRLDCKESGLCMRMFAPIAALLDRETTLVAAGSLHSRPMEMVDALGVLGASCRTDHGRAPIVVRGPMEGGHIAIDAALSSQFLTGLLMALPVCRNGSHVLVSGLKSVPYVHMTLELLRTFGVTVDHDDRLTEFRIEGDQTYRPCSYQVEGDWSGAAFPLVAAAIGGSVVVTGLNIRSFQADKAVLEALEMVGARVTTGEGDLSVERQGLKPFVFDATHCPDLFPPLVSLAACCEGKSIIHGVERLAHKESDRAVAIKEEFARLGITVKIAENRMEVFGGHVRAGKVDSHNDHRIAMACAVAALRADGEVVIEGSGCVAKSYPGFFEDLHALTVRP